MKKTTSNIKYPFKQVGTFDFNGKKYPYYCDISSPVFQVRDAMEFIGYNRTHKELLSIVPKNEIFRVNAVKIDKNGRRGSRSTDMITIGGVLYLAANATSVNRSHASTAKEVFCTLYNKWVRRVSLDTLKNVNIELK